MLDQDVAEFVKKVGQFPDGARGKDLPLADRKQDRIRQKARRMGLVVCEDRGSGRRWYVCESKEPK